jgi:phosphoribosylaminoimidazolecarboxamide formyltransferase/IMP cyclohydrolase
VHLAHQLIRLDFEIVATGSTSAEIKASGVPVQSVDEITGFPEILGGRVKTLHPKVFGGILARPSLQADSSDLAANGLVPVGVVVCNLYPFAQSAAEGRPLNELIEKIDIGGVSLLRAAAKNHLHVVVLCDPADYVPVLQKLARSQLTLDDRRMLALKALQLTAAYDSLIAEVLAQRFASTAVTEGATAEVTAEVDQADRATPVTKAQRRFVALEKVTELRYGENPHQGATLYRTVVPMPGSLHGEASFDLTKC